jgi:uncharacterized protein (TIGR04168 family)
MRIGVVGDIHGNFNEADVAYFNGSDLDLLLFVGDLPAWPWPWQVRRMARQIARITKPALLIPGNHDVHNGLQLLAEVRHDPTLARLSAWRHTRFHRHLEQWLAPVALAGYSTHTFRDGAFSVTVVAARPYSMGGPALSFAPLLEEMYGVASLSVSAARLNRCVQEARGDVLLFLAHNGPRGLGEGADDIWGRDFGRGGGDWGDVDLAAAIDHARAVGRRVVAVVGGHMHRGTRQGRQRAWLREREGITYINAAQVPRIIRDNKGARRHHLRLEVTVGGVADIRNVWVEKGIIIDPDQ